MNTRLLLLITACALPSTALAQSPAQPLEPLFACQAIANDTQRLACLDAAVASLQSDASSGEVIVIDREGVEAAEAASFGLVNPGFRLPSMPRFGAAGEGSNALDEAAQAASNDSTISRDADDQIERIDNLAISDIEFDRMRQVTITLENGQIWRQIESDAVRLLGNVDTSRGASIRTASLGSYMMRIGDRGRWLRVRRVQ